MMEEQNIIQVQNQTINQDQVVVMEHQGIRAGQKGKEDIKNSICLARSAMTKNSFTNISFIHGI